jgi:hypothetical protein
VRSAFPISRPPPGRAGTHPRHTMTTWPRGRAPPPYALRPRSPAR